MPMECTPLYNNASQFWNDNKNEKFLYICDIFIVMRSKIIFTIVVAMLLFSVASCTVLAKEGGSLINELTEIDSFHPPDINDPKILMYNEWHYFNVIDEEQNLSVVTVLRLTGDIYDPLNSSAIVMLSYSTPGGINITGDFYSITQAQYSNETPDLQIDNSTVTLSEEGYHVHVESANNQTVFDARFKPVAVPPPVFNISYNPPLCETINWLVASPKMKVTGKLTINKGTQLEKTYTLKNTRGYHDHNWGFWRWDGDIGWDWGQMTETKNHLEGNDLGKYTLCFGNITNNNHTKSMGAVLNVMKNKKIIGTFNNEAIHIQHYSMITPIPEFPNNSFPLDTVITADYGENSMNITFNTEHFDLLPIQIGINKYLVIWELTGTYHVSGYIDGKPVSYTSKGFLEYVA